MVLIRNAFHFSGIIGPIGSFKIWTKEPKELEEKCVATDVSITRSYNLHEIAYRDDNSHYVFKKDEAKKYRTADLIEILDSAIGYTYDDKGNPTVKPLGNVLYPKTYVLAMALVNLTTTVNHNANSYDNSVTDIVMRDLIFTPDSFTRDELKILRKAGHIPSEHVMLQLTADIYRR